MTGRRRLTPGRRRGELLDVGARLFAARPYDEVLLEDVAAAIGVSRALLYRYFPAKRDLFAAIYRRAADGLLAATQLDPGLPLAEQLAAGLDLHIDYFIANRHTVLAANLALAGDPIVSAIISAELADLRNRLIDVSAVPEHRREFASIVLLSWLVQVQTVCVEWLANQTVGRDELRDVCAGALLGGLAPLLDA